MPPYKLSQALIWTRCFQEESGCRDARQRHVARKTAVCRSRAGLMSISSFIATTAPAAFDYWQALQRD